MYGKKYLLPRSMALLFYVKESKRCHHVARTGKGSQAAFEKSVLCKRQLRKSGSQTPRLSSSGSQTDTGQAEALHDRFHYVCRRRLLLTGIATVRVWSKRKGLGKAGNEKQVANDSVAMTTTCEGSLS
ncbi:hypothetical protein BIW11_13163 [Tropilaelaps mercedesae]|uniref:Uncharacterized protein n=1 Tax=Tropilaelaps mercedesae TaxID=418985 RepID=A0A1V9X454_9ACAR|nr:hypothetical protein BIW11_13163 [Tropilaelaps mercedesae]